jgi:hypothetical protein
LSFPFVFKITLFSMPSSHSCLWLIFNIVNGYCVAGCDENAFVSAHSYCSPLILKKGH